MEELYEEEWMDIGYYLSILSRQLRWNNIYFKQIRWKAYNYLLQGDYLWKRYKRDSGISQRVIYKKKMQGQLIQEFHDSLQMDHRGIYATFNKLKERYWWYNMYRDVIKFVKSCQTCQMYSEI